MKYTYIDTIDFSAFKCLKKDKLFYDDFEQKYYKIWKEDTIIWDRRISGLFLLAVSSGFYDNVTEFDSILISDNGTCVGYSMNSCSCPMKEVDGKCYGDIIRKRNRHGFSVIKNASEQNSKYVQLYKNLTDNAKRTGFFYYDLVQSNIADFGDRYGVIDLESVANIRDLYKIPSYHLDCIPRDYFKFLENLYDETIGLANSGVHMGLINRAWSMSTGGMGCKSYYSVTINGEYFEGERPWESRWSMLKRLCWKDLKILDLGTCMGMVPAFLLKYCGLDKATAIDMNPVHIEATEIVRQAFKIPKKRMRIIKLNLDESDYEDLLGYDYDVIFCLSFLRWVKNKEKFLNYLSKFENVILEPHDLDGDFVKTFKDIGFNNNMCLGESRIGHSFSDKKKRVVYYFWKKEPKIIC